MTNVVSLKKVSEYTTILGMCDVTEKLVKRDRRLTAAQRREKLQRVSRTRAKCAAKLDELKEGAPA